MHADGARPEIIDPTEDLDRLRRLARTAATHDTIRLQVAELLEGRTPERKPERAELEARVTDELGKDPERYGLWVHYPWSNRLVHVLPEQAFRELRTSRNRNKITRDEQARLAGATLGVVGLSVGQATAITLALEGMFGTLRLADFDTLSLSNLNRLRAGVHELGVNKAVITARAIWELDPFARIELFEEGIVERNIARFLDGLDLLFEECDDLRMKVRLREEARTRRIPVLMETSDRGLLDVERYDLEPERPLFHGLAGELRADRLSGLSNYEKVPVILAILGTSTMSARLASSLIDVEVTLPSWPQLASAVALGGAINADTARRVLLKQFSRSGRYFVDPEEIVTDAPRHADSEPAPAPAHAAPRRAPIDRAALKGALSVEQLETVVHYASLAPSGGNAQPWRFVYRERDAVLESWIDPARAGSYLDFERRSSHLAHGAVAENVRLACATLGIPLQLTVLPEPSQPDLAFTARLGRPGAVSISAQDRLLAECVPLRVTNRRIGTRAPLPDALARELEAMVGSAGVLSLVTDPAKIAAFGELHGETERLRALHAVMHQEFLHEIRWTAEDAERTRDGIDVATLEMSPTDLAGMSVLARTDVVETMRRIEAGHGLRQASIKACAGASAIGLLRAPGTQPASYFQGGVAMQRIWLLANARGFALQPMMAMLYVYPRLDVLGDHALSAGERAGYARTRTALSEIFPPRQGHGDMFAFRLTRAEPPTARALRLTIDEVLHVAP